MSKQKTHFDEAFQAHIIQQMSRMSQFFMVWNKMRTIKVADQQEPMELMLNYLVIDFSSTKQRHLNLASDMDPDLSPYKLLVSDLKYIQTLLYQIFFAIPDKKKPQFILVLLEKLLASVEILLDTVYTEQLFLQAEEELDFQLLDECLSPKQRDQIRHYLLNVKAMVGIIANIFNNQFKILIRKGVTYDRETFSYEKYTSVCLHENRMLKKTMFEVSGKDIVAEFYKFQRKEAKENQEFDLRTANQIGVFLDNMTLHIDELYQLDKILDIESILHSFIVVYFSPHALQRVSKDALSRVSKNFFKEIKMNYRNLPSLSEHLICVYKFFDLTKDETLQSFFQFNLINLCENIANEHIKFVFTILEDRNFIQQPNVNKFCEEMWKLNHIMETLFHLDFTYNRYMSVKIFRDVQHRVKKFCEFADRKIERAVERNWNTGGKLQIEIPQKRLNN